MLSSQLKFLFVDLGIDRWGKIFFFQNYLFFIFKYFRKLNTLVCVNIILLLINKLNILTVLIVLDSVLILVFNIFTFEKILFILFVDIIIIHLKFNINIFNFLILKIWSILLLRAIIWVHIFHSWKPTDFFYLIFIFLNDINSLLAQDFVIQWLSFILSWLTQIFI